MSKIPKKLLAELLADPFYQRCAVSGDFSTKKDSIEFHHNLIFGGKQVQAKFAILPIKRSLHLKANNKRLKAQLDWVMWNRATEEEIRHYSKAIDQGFYLATLNMVFGVYVPAAELSLRY